MGVFNNFPWTNFHELNLDWVIKTVKELQDYLNSPDYEKYIQQVIINNAERLMFNGSYVEEDEQIILSYIIESVADPSSHIYNSGTETMSIEED